MTKEEFDAMIEDMTEEELAMVYEGLLRLKQATGHIPLPHPKDQPPKFHQTDA